MKKLFFIPLAIILVVGLIMTGCGGGATTAPTTTAPTTSAPTTAAPTTSAPKTTAPTTAAPTTAAPAAGTIELKAATFLPRQNYSVWSMFPLIERVNAQAAGKVKITYVGGPEVMPPTQMPEAVRNNVIQLAFVPFEYYETLTHMGNTGQLSQLTPLEEVASGAYAYMNELCEKNGLHLLGRATAMNKPNYFWFIIKKKIARPQEFAGMKIGASSTWPNPLMKKLGATMVQIPITDFYTSLERGVVDGVGDPLTNHITFQLYQVSKYVVEPGVGQGAGSAIVNLATWNKIPKETQDLITKIFREVVVEFQNGMDGEMAKAKDTALKNGMEYIKFTPEDEKFFVDTYYTESWAENIARYPDVAPKLRELMTKK